MVKMQWGMPPPPRTGGPTTDIRNTPSPHWRIWQKPENRCLVPANSFAEYAPEPNPKKLTYSGHATNSSCWRCRRHGSGSERLDLDDIAEVGQTFDKALFLLVGGTSIEMIAAEVLVHRAILEHVVDRGKD